MFYPLSLFVRAKSLYSYYIKPNLSIISKIAMIMDRTNKTNSNLYLFACVTNKAFLVLPYSLFSSKNHNFVFSVVSCYRLLFFLYLIFKFFYFILQGFYFILMIPMGCLQSQQIEKRIKLYLSY